MKTMNRVEEADILLPEAGREMNAMREAVAGTDRNKYNDDEDYD